MSKTTIKITIPEQFVQTIINFIIKGCETIAQENTEFELKARQTDTKTMEIDYKPQK